jgi:acetyl esterase/lipase
MRTETIRLWEQEEYHYEASFGFIPEMHAYIHDEQDETFPGIVILPGGGYTVVSPAEAEVVALYFYERGFNCFVVTYTTNLLLDTPLKLQPLHDVSRAIRLIRSQSAGLQTKTNQIAICGFSAGGHLAACMSVLYNDVIDSSPELQKFNNRPDAAILAYPVIKMKQYTHSVSMRALLGENATEDEKLYFSLDQQVNPNVPPCFLWHTATDDIVPVENSMDFARALHASKVPYALHIFAEGPHGLSLLTDPWMRGEFGEPYTMDPIVARINSVKQQGIELSPQLQGLEKDILATRERTLHPKPFDMDNPHIQYLLLLQKQIGHWPELATSWLRGTFSLQ